RRTWLEQSRAATGDQAGPEVPFGSAGGTLCRGGLVGCRAAWAVLGAAIAGARQASQAVVFRSLIKRHLARHSSPVGPWPAASPRIRRRRRVADRQIALHRRP